MPIARDRYVVEIGNYVSNGVQFHFASGLGVQCSSLRCSPVEGRHGGSTGVQIAENASNGTSASIAEVQMSFQPNRS